MPRSSIDHRDGVIHAIHDRGNDGWYPDDGPLHEHDDQRDHECQNEGRPEARPVRAPARRAHLLLVVFRSLHGLAPLRAARS